MKDDPERCRPPEEPGACMEILLHSYEQGLSAASDFLERRGGHPRLKMLRPHVGVHVRKYFLSIFSVRAAAIVLPISLGLLPHAVFSQPQAAQGDTVTWTVQSSDVARNGKATLTLNGHVREGWHVYALQQSPEGPTPLLVTLDANTSAKADGAVTGSPPTTIHDPAFGIDTQFYESAFSLTVPVRLGSRPAGRQSIPLSVRFQTCNGRVCQPPKTVHLSANPQTGG